MDVAPIFLGGRIGTRIWACIPCPYGLIPWALVFFVLPLFFFPPLLGVCPFTAFRSVQVSLRFIYVFVDFTIYAGSLISFTSPFRVG
jgi:hypothetical protein